MYAQVHFRFQQGQPPILIPGTAMIFRTSAPQAAVVGGDSIAHFHNLKIGRDYGTVIEVDSGLADGDYVVAEPNDQLRDGQPVHAKIENEAGAPVGDTRSGQPIPPPPVQPDPKTQPGQLPRPNGPAGSAPGAPQAQTSAASPGQPQAPTARAKTSAPGYRPPPQLQEGFPAAPAASRPQ
jgi:hypothetical protein